MNGRVTEVWFEDLISFFGKGVLTNGRPVLVWQYKPEFLTPKILTQLTGLAERLVGMRHPNLLEMIGFEEHSGGFFTYHEYHDALMSLEVALQERNYTLSQRWGFSTQIAGAMKLLEDQGLAWGGLNLNHVMVDANGQLKLTKVVLPSVILRMLLRHSGVVDDAPFLAPEWLEIQHYTTRSDIFAYGVLLYHLFGKGWPYLKQGKVDALKKRFLAAPKTFQPHSAKIPSRLGMLITLCIQTDPNRRFETFTQMLAQYQSEAWSHPQPTPATSSPLQWLLAGSVKEAMTQIWAKWAKKIAVGSLGLLIIVAGLKWMDYSISSDQLPLNQIPKLRGMTAQEAIKFLEDHKLHGVIAGSRMDPKIPSGSVVETKPPEGREVRDDREVKLYLSRGPGVVIVPHLIGKTFAQAANMVSRPATLNITEEVYSYATPKGIILSQRPSPNAKVTGAINITVSGGYPVTLSSEGTQNGLTTVNVYVGVLNDGPAQQILIQAKSLTGAMTTLHNQSHAPGFQNTMSFEVNAGSTILVSYNGNLVHKESLE